MGSRCRLGRDVLPHADAVLDMTREQALVNELVAQRNDAQNKLADALADLTVTRVELAAAQARVTDVESLRERLAALEAQIPKE